MIGDTCVSRMRQYFNVSYQVHSRYVDFNIAATVVKKLESSRNIPRRYKSGKSHANNFSIFNDKHSMFLNQNPWKTLGNKKMSKVALPTWIVFVDLGSRGL